MNKTKLSVMVLDDNPNQAHKAVQSAIASVADAPLEVENDSPWTISLGAEREIEITLEREVMTSLSLLNKARAFLVDPEEIRKYDIILVDMNWSGDGGSETEGLDLVEMMAAAKVHHPYVALYTQDDVEPSWLLRALSANAKAVINKTERIHLLNLFVTAAETTSLRRIVDASRNALETVDIRLRSQAPVMRECVAEAGSYAPNPRLHVLITGPTGSGKEVIARAIHQASRAGKPFEPVDCAGLINADLAMSALFGHEKGAYTGASGMSRGYFERASGGTVFLDEVHTLPPEIHTMLHRVIQDGEFIRLGGQEWLKTDVRVISATTKDPNALVSSGAFADDFINRISGCRIDVPGLNQRREDIPTIAGYFLESFQNAMKRPAARLTPAALTVLCEHNWERGNVRELRWVIERSFTRSRNDDLQPEDLIFSLDDRAQQADKQLAGQRLTTKALSRLERARPRESNQQKVFDRLRAQYPNVVSYRELHEDLGLADAPSDTASDLLINKMSLIRNRLKSFGFTIDRAERQGYNLRILEEASWTQ